MLEITYMHTQRNYFRYSANCNLGISVNAFLIEAANWDKGRIALSRIQFCSYRPDILVIEFNYSTKSVSMQSNIYVSNLVEI